MDTTKYSPADFAKALEKNEFSSNTPITLTGMVKRDEQDASVILFTPRGCGSWIPVPLSSIAGDIEDLGSRVCRDHHHRYVRFQLKDAPSVEGAILRALLQSDAESDADFPERDAARPTMTPRAGAYSARAFGGGGYGGYGGSDCESACSICRRTGKPGPCWVCDNCYGGW